MKELVVESKRAWQSLGKISYGMTEKERDSKRFRRSVYAVTDIKAGDTFKPDNIRIIRPGFGLSPKYYDVLLGKKASQDIKKGTPMEWGLVG